jgi:hypothetical protein
MEHIRNCLDNNSSNNFDVYAVPSFALLYSIDEIIDHDIQ